MIAVSIFVVCGTGFLPLKDHASPDCSQREAVNAQKANPDDGQCRAMREDSVLARAQIVAFDNGKIIAELDPDFVEVIETGDLVCFN